jgi:DnaJ-class molecular chaperone
MSKNLYSVLGVNKNAETNEIRSAYKQLAREHHPDKGGNPEKFKELSQAHEILTDDSRRKTYDMTGSISDQPQQPQGFGMPFGMPDVFSQMFGGGQSQRKRDGKGPGKNQDIPLRLADFYHGRNLSIKLGRQCFCKTCSGSGGASTRPCQQCGGSGQLTQMVHMGPIQMMTQTTCPPCNGKGKQNIGTCLGCSGRGMTHEEKTMDIKVEPGMMPGNTIVFNGMCSDHPNFTEAGDVTVILRESDEDNADTAKWSREGSKLKITVSVSLTESLLGTIKILKGHPGFTAGLPIEIPAGAQNLWSGAFPGLGMPIRGTPRFGEAYITLLVVPTEEETQLLKANGNTIRAFMPTVGPGPDGVISLNVGKWTA